MEVTYDLSPSIGRDDNRGDQRAYFHQLEPPQGHYECNQECITDDTVWKNHTCQSL